MRKTHPVLGWLLWLAALATCQREEPGDSERAEALAEPTPPRHAPSARAAAPAETRPIPTKQPPLAPRTLLRREETAYGASLDLRGDGLRLLTPRAIHRIEGAEGPVDTRALPLGVSATVHDDAVVYWSDGEIRRATVSGGEPEVVAELPSEPQQLVAGDAGLAWLRHDAERGYILETWGKRGVVQLYASRDRLSSPTIMGEEVFAVQSRIPAEHKLVAVSLRNRKVREEQWRFGRTPSMVVAREGSLYYYDGPRRAVRRISADFERDELVGRDTICSPLAVTDRIWCAQVGGIVFIDPRTGETHPLVPERRGPITAIAADEGRVAWVTDLGRQGLGVSTVATPGPALP